MPRDPNDDKSVIVEIRGGVGGEESALFAHSLYRMYTMYAQSKGWKVTLLNYNETELGGVKEADFEIDPKVIDMQNVGCEFCPYRDLCYKTPRDYIYIETKGGEEDADMDARAATSN